MNLFYNQMSIPSEFFVILFAGLISFMILVKVYHKAKEKKGDVNPDEILIGKYNGKNIDLSILSKRIQEFLHKNNLKSIKVKTSHDPEFKETIIASQGRLRQFWIFVAPILNESHVDIVRIMISGNSNDFAVTRDFSSMKSAMNYAFSTYGSSIEKKSKRFKDQIIEEIEFLIHDMSNETR